MAIAAAEMPMQYVTPAVWKRYFRIGRLQGCRAWRGDTAFPGDGWGVCSEER
jgi:hypothetical protein